MADEINPTFPVSPSLPVNPPPDDKRRHAPKKQDKSNQEQAKDEDKTERPHHGLFDEYV